jgi:S-adenosylmethionine decarboxylase
VNALGRHLLVELYDCDVAVIDNLDMVKRVVLEAARLARATVVDVVFHAFSPFGISGVVVIAESHLSVHTWPEYGYAAVDVFTCSDGLQVAEAIRYLIGRFAAQRTSIVEVQRGMFLGSGVPKVSTGVEVLNPA